MKKTIAMEENDNIEFDINQPVEESQETASEPTRTENERPAKKKEPRRKLRIGKHISNVVSGRVLAKESIKKKLPLAAMILLYSFLLIANRYKIETLTIENKQLQKQIDELRVRKIATHCEYMNTTMLTEVAYKLQSKNIKEGNTPSMKITIKNKKAGDE